MHLQVGYLVEQPLQIQQVDFLAITMVLAFSQEQSEVIYLVVVILKNLQEVHFSSNLNNNHNNSNNNNNNSNNHRLKDLSLEQPILLPLRLTHYNSNKGCNSLNNNNNNSNNNNNNLNNNSSNSNRNNNSNNNKQMQQLHNWISAQMMFLLVNK